MFWWERDPTEPDLEEPEEEYHMAPDLTSAKPCLIPTDIEDSSSSTSSDEFPDKRPPHQLSAHPSLRMSIEKPNSAPEPPSSLMVIPRKLLDGYTLSKLILPSTLQYITPMKRRL